MGETFINFFCFTNEEFEIHAWKSMNPGIYMCLYLKVDQIQQK